MPSISYFTIGAASRSAAPAVTPSQQRAQNNEQEATRLVREPSSDETIVDEEEWASIVDEDERNTVVDDEDDWDPLQDLEELGRQAEAASANAGGPTAAPGPPRRQAGPANQYTDAQRRMIYLLHRHFHMKWRDRARIFNAVWQDHLRGSGIVDGVS